MALWLILVGIPKGEDDDESIEDEGVVLGWGTFNENFGCTRGEENGIGGSEKYEALNKSSFESFIEITGTFGSNLELLFCTNSGANSLLEK